MTAAVQKRWSKEEIVVFDARRLQKVGTQSIADELGRTFASVHSRCQKANNKKHRDRMRALEILPRLQIEPIEEPPPLFVIRERGIRLSIPPISITQMTFRDPVAGYSALDNKARTISVQDALEICALHNGKRGEIAALAASYHVSTTTINHILDGTFFDRLIPRKIVPQEVVDDG